MECRQLHRDELAEKYLHGQLDPAARDEFEVHVLECEPCQRQVEAILTLRQELAQRAPQIRAYAQVERPGFRWQWVTVAAFALVVCVGLVEFQRMKATKSAKLQVRPPSSNSITVGETIEVPTTKSSSANSPLVDHLPVDGRNYINFTLKDSHVPRDRAPSTGAAPSPGWDAREQPARSSLVHVDGADAADNSVNGARVSAPPQDTNSAQTPPGPEKVLGPEAASDEAAKELFRLGTAQAPPYTFSGLASSSARAVNTDPRALSGKSGKSAADQQRPFFRDAMAAYVDQRYTDASDLLEQAARAEPNVPDVSFYLGVCRLLLGKPADAIAPLQSVLADEKSLWAQSAHFYLAKAYVQTGDLTQAEEQLQAAAGMAGNLKAEAASELTRLQSIRAGGEKPIP
jgi:hypothetical protein